jgi:hypothetical protein
MKQKWLYAVLVLSLAVNAGVLGFYGVKKYQDWRNFQDYQGKWFRPGTTRHQLDGLFANLMKSRAPWFDTLRTATKELGLLALEANPDSARVGNALDRIAHAQREETRLLRVNMRELHRLYRPEKLEVWRKLVQAERDSALKDDSSATQTSGGAR